MQNGGSKALSWEERSKLIVESEDQKSSGYVLYWMQQSQRVKSNETLAAALHRAKELGTYVQVCFVFTPDYPGAGYRHFRFVLEGLKDLKTSFEAKNIPFCVKVGHPPDVIEKIAKIAKEVFWDPSEVNPPRSWRDTLADRLTCTVTEVDSETVVPPSVVSGKREFAARTIRPKIHRNKAPFINAVRISSGPKVSGQTLESDIDLSKTVESLLAELSIKKGIDNYEPRHLGGEREASRTFQKFLSNGLKGYAESRKIALDDRASGLSPYLQYGQISAVAITIAVMDHDDSSKEDREAFLEELIVRRELAYNFCHYEKRYDSFDSMPNWCKITLKEHRQDEREYTYSYRQLELSKTHDDLWNNCMATMREHGVLHNQLRMYWGKKIVEWSKDPETAYKNALRLNNTYFLDGFNPNSYMNIGWLFGLHDRPWKERDIFGKVRYMSRKGTERKMVKPSTKDKNGTKGKAN